MTLPSLIAVAALFVAVLALARARRVAKRLERLTETYWELRYEHGQLRARLSRLDPEQAASPEAAPVRAGGASTTFVPLSSLKR